MNENRGIWRGKCADNNGEWVEGDLSRIKSAKQYFITDHIHHWPWRVEPSTLGECVGLPDKNDTLIFEGDIVKTLETDSNGKQCCFPVVQSHGAFWLYDELLDSKLDFLGSYEKEALEIIGNIHDNPELIKLGGSDGR